MSNKIRLKIKTLDQLKLILDDIKDSVQPEIEITLNLQENKETMSYLCKSQYIEDWDYVAENKEAVKEKIAENLPSEKEDLGFFKSLGIEKEDWNMIAWIIDAIWRTAKTRPAIIFQSNFFYESVKDNIQKTASPEHVLLTMTGESYYSGYSWDLVEKDLSEKLHNIWPSKIKNMTLTEVATILYKE